MSDFRFGQPWHGEFSSAGLLLEGGLLKTEWPGTGIYGQFTTYAHLGAPAAPAATAEETALGMVWKNDVVFWGQAKAYHPSGGRTLGSTGWLYKCTDGTIYHLIMGFSGTTVSVYIANYGQINFTVINSITGVAGPSGDQTLFSSLVNQSPSGDKALFHYFRQTVNNDPSYRRPGAVHIIVEASVSGGSATAAPSIALTKICDYDTATTTVDWENPANFDDRSFGNDYEDYLDAGSQDVTTYCLSGYTQAGAVQLITLTRSLEWFRSGTRTGDTTYSMTSIKTDASALNVNGSAVYSYPVFHRDRTVDYNIVSNGSIVYLEEAEVVTDVLQNAAYENFTGQVFYPGNCLVAALDLAPSGDPDQSRVVCHLRSHFGTVHTDLDGSHDDGIIAAFNPRTEQIAVGIGKGFV